MTMDEKAVESLKEISAFLNSEARADLKDATIQQVLGSAAGRELLLKLPEILKKLVILLQDNAITIAKAAALALINLTADEGGSSALLVISESFKYEGKFSSDLIHVCLKYVMDRNINLADPCCMILSNMTRPSVFVDRILALFDKTGYSWDSIIAAFCKKGDTNCATSHYLGPVFSNLSQSPKVRRHLTDRTRGLIRRLLPFTEYAESELRRGGIVGTLRNCCFDLANHDWFLGPEIDILPHLLLPLAGPEEFDDEDTNKLPIDLQYLPETKQRESDTDIRLMLLESLTQLCASKKGREYLREKNAYVILRELHKWEKDKVVLLACENLVDILIRTEEEIGVDNLKEIEVPEEYKDKFHKMDEEFISS
ncbi:protein HGH1 homolog isoform X2 [Belonocnema kinseyi]|uniref:protein HGH1 homolog isoform X2 n=1 Tax=Belonocnema kinseyi TaxID=2817044 RepID=UPI00143DC508|nr:protein HGH1 homolog isoform X2 [Belonocnema kinseyi]